MSQITSVYDTSRHCTASHGGGTLLSLPERVTSQARFGKGAHDTVHSKYGTASWYCVTLRAKACWARQGRCRCLWRPWKIIHVSTSQGEDPLTCRRWLFIHTGVSRRNPGTTTQPFRSYCRSRFTEPDPSTFGSYGASGDGERI